LLWSPLPLTTSNHQQLDQVGIHLQDRIKIDHWIALRGVREDLATARTDSLSYATGVTTVATKSDEAATRRGAVTTTSVLRRWFWVYEWSSLVCTLSCC
jgi:iron complex outermembrane receptor protein